VRVDSMKKFLILIMVLFFVLPAFADTMPYYTNAIPKSALGVFQTGEKLTIYAQPESNSKVLKEFEFSYNTDTMPDGVFALLLNERKLGLMYVTDIGDDNWVEVMYDKKTGAKGWVLTEDRFQFMPWINFYNMYGRKYGLRLFKDAPDEVDVLHSKADDLSQNVAKINYVKTIKLTKLSGNWALVSVLDLDKINKMGFMRWRSDNGVIYAFPNIK
jgi:hypothetical protein